jgi:hypothetical protein
MLRIHLHTLKHLEISGQKEHVEANLEFLKITDLGILECVI